MQADIQQYNQSQSEADSLICAYLADLIDEHLQEAESKIWHAHPVWFIEGNPIVGYSKQKKGIRLMFWSGADFEEEKLAVLGKNFKDASIFYTHIKQVQPIELLRWLKKAKHIQWDYQNIVKRKGLLIKRNTQPPDA